MISLMLMLIAGLLGGFSFCRYCIRNGWDIGLEGQRRMGDGEEANQSGA